MMHTSVIHAIIIILMINSTCIELAVFPGLFPLCCYAMEGEGLGIKLIFFNMHNSITIYQLYVLQNLVFQ